MLSRFLVLSSYYGVNGGDLKKLDSKSLILDFTIMQEMANPSFLTNLKSKMDHFIQELIANKESGSTYLL
jgi:hypothetical protein